MKLLYRGIIWTILSVGLSLPLGILLGLAISLVAAFNVPITRSYFETLVSQCMFLTFLLSFGYKVVWMTGRYALAFRDIAKRLNVSFSDVSEALFEHGLNIYGYATREDFALDLYESRQLGTTLFLANIFSI
jgi:hypothetical protein